jgi:fumarate reductase (CoM/CoB) subunit B
MKVLCCDPGKGKRSAYKTYEVPYSRRDKVLGSLIYIHQHLDPCLSFRFNCKGRHCGECAIMINGKPGLSCEVSMSRDLVLAPLKNLPLIKDLVIQRTKVYKEMIDSLPRVEIKERNRNRLRAIPLEIVNQVIRLDGCIHCLCCMSVCPGYKKKPEIFVGPMGLLVLAANRETTPDLKTHETARLCTECGRCEDVCPRNIPIPEAIKKLKGGDA